MLGRRWAAAQDAVFTPRLEQKFEQMKECTIRGQYVAASRWAFRDEGSEWRLVAGWCFLHFFSKFFWDYPIIFLERL